MGYTHYWYTKTFAPKVWRQLILDVGTLYANLPPEVVLTGCLKYGELPYFGEDAIWFNGKPDYETFVLHRENFSTREANVFNFCKTAQKPYDLMVCAVLLTAKYLSPDSIRLSSDGDEDDWQEAEQFVWNTLGYNVKYRQED
jgi:hypothetical protein